MTSTVTCRSRPEATLGDIFAALFPCGSVTGAPKAASMAAIAKLEGVPRGAYCGAIGVVKPGGDAIFSVGIRTAMVDAERALAECGIGSGIVMDSRSEAEYAEWQSKRAFLDHACPPYELLETLRLHRGRYWLRRRHIERLARSAAALGFVFDQVRVEEALADAGRRHGDGRARLRMAADGGVSVDVLPLDETPPEPVVAVAREAVSSSNPWLRHKTTRRELYEALAVRDEGIFDTLLCNERGEATEFTRGNLVASINGRLVTPPLACGLLPGVFRDALIASGRVREAVIARDDLSRADALWFVNSVRGAVRVRLAGASAACR